MPGALMRRTGRWTTRITRTGLGARNRRARFPAEHCGGVLRIASAADPARPLLGRRYASAQGPPAFAILYADARLAIRHEPNLSNSPASAVELFEITSSDQGRFDPALLCQAGDERLASGSPSAARDADASTSGRDVRIAARRGHIGSRAQCGQPVASGRKPHRRRIDPRRRCFASSAWSALLPNRLLAAARRTSADAAAVSPPPEVWFSGRRPRCQGPDVASPRVTDVTK